MPELPSFTRTRQQPKQRYGIIATLEAARLRRSIRWLSYFVALNYVLLLAVLWGKI